MDSAEIAFLVDTYVSYVGNILTCPPPLPSRDSHSWWLNCFQARGILGQLELPHFIDAIGEFPVIPEGLEYPTGDAAYEFISYRKSANKDVVKWLRSYLLKGLPIPEVLSKITRWEQSGWLPSQSPSQGLMSLMYRYLAAFESIQTLSLAKETYFKSSVLSSLFPTPFALWACIECSQERLSLRMHGITSNPVILGKTDYLENTALAIHAYRNFEVKAADEETPAWICEVHWSENLRTLLFTEAQKIAQKDEDFNKQYYTPYWRACRRNNNLLKRCDRMQSLYRLPDGSPFITRKYNQIPEEQKPKGFTPKRGEYSAYSKNKARASRKSKRNK